MFSWNMDQLARSARHRSRDVWEVNHSRTCFGKSFLLQAAEYRHKLKHMKMLIIERWFSTINRRTPNHIKSKKKLSRPSLCAFNDTKLCIQQMEGNRDCFNRNLNNICKEHIYTKSIMLQHTENGQSLTCLMLLFFSCSIPQSTHHAASGSNHGNSRCSLTRTCCYIFSGLHLKNILHILCGRKASSKRNLWWSASGAEERRQEQGIKRRKD